MSGDVRTKARQLEHGTQPRPRDPPARARLQTTAPGPVSRSAAAGPRQRDPGHGFGSDYTAAHGQPCAAFSFPERRSGPHSRRDISPPRVDDADQASERAFGTEKEQKDNGLRGHGGGARSGSAAPFYAR